MSEIEIAQKLISRKSITPKDDGAINYVAECLRELGFKIDILAFGADDEKILNLYARYGQDEPNLCFAGHTDVVPVGELNEWKSDPFKAEIDSEGYLTGRGAVDMKGAIAAFISAVKEFITNHKFKGSISFLITGDEEGKGINGTKKVLEHLKNKGEYLNFCIVGEPTNPERIGEMIKIGRRGSLTLTLEVKGIQGHVAYPKNSNNPVTTIINILYDLKNKKLDDGNEFFDPSNLEVVSIDVNNPTSNLIPAKADALINVRFNNQHSSDDIYKLVCEICSKHSNDYFLKIKSSSEAFLTKPNNFVKVIQEVIFDVVGIKASLSTTGGTSDARFIKDYTDVIEFGLINKTAHSVNEKIHITELATLKKIYYKLICRYFSVG